MAGLAAALVMGGGLGVLAGPGTASASACPAFDGTQPPVADVGAGSQFTGVAVAGPCDLWMVGHSTSAPGSQRALIEHWTGGPSWTAVPGTSIPGAAGGLLTGVSAVSPADVWAVGGTDTASPLALHWDGTSWTQKAVPESTLGLTAVTAVSARDVWAAGIGGDSQMHFGFLMHYDGASWTRTPAPDVAQASISGLAATSANDVWAVGETVDGSIPVPLVLHWDGTAWSRALIPGGGYQLNAVSASGPGDAWAVGIHWTSSFISTVILHWDGTSWTQTPSPNPGSPNNVLNGVAAISPTSAVAVGSFSRAASNSQPLVLHWDGHSWTQMQTPALGSGSELNAVAASPAGVWAAGFWRAPNVQASAMVFGTVPSVAGDTPAAATDAVNSAGLSTTVTDVTTAGGGCSPAANGTVFATSPAAGTFTAPPVNLSVCDMPPIVTVPAVTGLADNQAQGTLTNAGLSVGTITLSGNCSFDPGTVLRQTPAAGTTVNRGTPVNLTEATPPKPHGCAQ